MLRAAFKDYGRRYLKEAAAYQCVKVNKSVACEHFARREVVAQEESDGCRQPKDQQVSNHLSRGAKLKTEYSQECEGGGGRVNDDTQEHGCHVVHTTTLGGLCEHCPLQERRQAQGHEQDKRRHAVAVMRVVMS